MINRDGLPSRITGYPNKEGLVNMNTDQQLDQLLRANITREDCPAPEDLAAYILRELRGDDELRVAAHVRECPFCSYEALVSQPPEPRPRKFEWLIATLQPSFSLGLRDADTHNPREGQRNHTPPRGVRRYVAADLSIDLTIAPPDGDYWRITGRIKQGEKPVVDCIVTLRAGRRSYKSTSDAQGFFSFAQLPQGIYTLSARNESVRVQIQDIWLGEDENNV